MLWKACFVALLIAATSQAGVILTFDSLPLSVPIDQSYGDRVSAVSASYGTFGTGFTPNVVVAYDGREPVVWLNDFGDLVNVLENEWDGDDRLTITFTADPGYLVRLHSFDLGGWLDTNRTLPGLYIRNGAGTNLYSATNLPVLGSPTASPAHTNLTFAPLSGSTLQIYLDLTGLGGGSDEIGIDNIAFDQVAFTPVPEPATMALWAGGLGLLALLRRRR